MVEATKGAYPLGTPNSVPPNAVFLRGNLTQSDSDVVLSTILLKDSRYGQAQEQRLEQKRLELTWGVAKLLFSRK
jgi:hypothetical protein